MAMRVCGNGADKECIVSFVTNICQPVTFFVVMVLMVTVLTEYSNSHQLLTLGLLYYHPHDVARMGTFERSQLHENKNPEPIASVQFIGNSADLLFLPYTFYVPLCVVLCCVPLSMRFDCF